MKKPVVLLITFLSCIAVDGRPANDNAVNLFPLSDVKITSGEMLTIQKLSHKYLLTLEPDRLLSWFRREAGLTPLAQPYPLWESDDFHWLGPLPGHIMGFYLSGMSMMYQSTGDNAIIEKLKYTLDGLKEVQDVAGDGYLLPTRIGRHIFEDVVDGNFTTSNPAINDTWEPVYVMNKIMLGLYDVYTLCGLQEAKPILVQMADWFGSQVLDRMSHESIQRMLVCEHGSINESYVDVYLITKDPKYLKWAEELNDEDMWVPLSEGRDILQGWHANTQIPKFTGFISVGRHNGDTRLLNAATLFWDIVVRNHTWVTGGNSSGEHFFPEDEYLDKVRSIGGPESCNSVNMMRLTESLYQMDGDPRRVDYYERVLLNHILGNFDPEVGMSCYYTSMRPGHYKVYADPYNCFWCCVGTGLQAPAKLARMVYGYKDNTLYVNMFVPTALAWKERNFRIEQSTCYPDENQSRISVKSDGNVKMAIRQPYWAEDFTVSVNDKELSAGDYTYSDGYWIIGRRWKAGDEILIRFTPRIEVKPLKKFDQYMTIQYGAYVMGARIDNHGLTHDDFIRPDDHANPTAMESIPESEVPVLMGSAQEIEASVRTTDSKELKLLYTSSIDTVELIPFTRILFGRYVVYFPHYDTAEEMCKRMVEQTVADYPSEAQEDYFRKIEVDRVLIGDAESEEKHKIESYRSETGTTDTQNWRHSFDGGFFMYEMKCLPDHPVKLAVRYCQEDSGKRVFDVQVDGKTIRTTDHSQKMAGVDKPLYYDEIDIPADLTKGKGKVTVKFNAHNHNVAGGVYDLRMLKR